MSRSLVAILLSALALGGCVFQPDIFSNDLAARASTHPGRNIARFRCGYCHAVEHLGNSRHPDAPPFRDLRNRYDSATLAARLSELSIHGHGRMPPYQFAPSEIDRLVDYIQHAR